MEPLKIFLPGFQLDHGNCLRFLQKLLHLQAERIRHGIVDPLLRLGDSSDQEMFSVLQEEKKKKREKDGKSKSDCGKEGGKEKGNKEGKE